MLAPAAAALPPAALAQVRIPTDLLRLVPRDLAVRHQVLPLRRARFGLEVAVADPLACDATDLLAHVVGLDIEPVGADAADLRRAIERHYGVGAAAEPAPAGDPAEVTITTAPGDPTEATDPADDAPVVRLVHQLITVAVQRRASDIHLEPLAGQFRVRLRIDGVLHEAEGPPRRLHPAVISRLKIMGGLSIAERRLPQDGRIRTEAAGRALDLRVATIPTVHGESMVLRLLDDDAQRPGVDALGLDEADRATLERLLSRPDGMVLVTGPTGAGKTTTLYACLQQLNQSDRKIVTVEDPIESQLGGVNQVPVRPAVGLTFAAALRAMLRQAPNVVMVGEIRDRETAEIALQAALTGHLVCSSLHTNDAVGAVTRLVDLGAKPYLVAAGLRGVVAQRLVRRVCGSCRETYAPTAAEWRQLAGNAPPPTGVMFARGRGCPDCLGTGFRGRIGVFEILEVHEALRALIHGGAGPAQLRAAAAAAGLRSLRADGLRKVSAGLTTVEEIASIIYGDTD